MALAAYVITASSYSTSSARPRKRPSKAQRKQAALLYKCKQVTDHTSYDPERTELCEVADDIPYEPEDLVALLPLASPLVPKQLFVTIIIPTLLNLPQVKLPTLKEIFNTTDSDVLLISVESSPARFSPS